MNTPKSIWWCLFAVLALSGVTVGEETSNGITVGRPKWYSNEMLRSMMARTQRALAGTDVSFDTQSAIGRLQGFSSDSQSSSFQMVLVPMTSTSVIKTLSATQKIAGETSESSTTSGTEEKTTPHRTVDGFGDIPQADYDRIRSIYSIVPKESGGFGLSALTLLQERMQLAYELLNYQYLFASSLDEQLNRRTILVGFDISVQPDREKRHHLAEVRIKVQGDSTDADRAVSVVSMFPQKNTYNTVNFVENLDEVGAGIVLGPISFGGGGSSSSQQGYLIQDTDLLAAQFGPDEFGWQFKSTLGREFVEPGIRRVYARLSVPADRFSENDQLKLTIRSNWKRVDSESRVMKLWEPSQSVDAYCNCTTELRLASPESLVPELLTNKIPNLAQYPDPPTPPAKSVVLQLMARVPSGDEEPRLLIGGATYPTQTTSPFDEGASPMRLAANGEPDGTLLTTENLKYILQGMHLTASNFETIVDEVRQEAKGGQNQKKAQQLSRKLSGLRVLYVTVPESVVKSRSTPVTILNEWGANTYTLEQLFNKATEPPKPSQLKYRVLWPSLVVTGKELNNKMRFLVDGQPFDSSRGNLQFISKTVLTLRLPKAARKIDYQVYSLSGDKPEAVEIER